MKMMRKELALQRTELRWLERVVVRRQRGRTKKGSLQAEGAEKDHNANVEEMRDAKGETEEYAYYSSPIPSTILSVCV